MPDFNDTVKVTRPWSDWIFLQQQRNSGGGGGFHIHNPWGNSTQPQGADSRNRLEIGYQRSTGQSLWGQLVIHGPTGRVGIGLVEPTEQLHVNGNVRANDFLVNSDARLKTEIRPIQDAARKINELRGVEFSWKPEHSGHARSCPATGAGVVAQEVEAVAPELVGQAAEGDYRTVNMSGLIGTLIEAFKELSAENRSLGRRIEELERGRSAEPAVTAG